MFAFAIALPLAGCTLLANGKINRTLDTRVPRGAPEARLVIEDLGETMRQVEGLLEVTTPVDGRTSQIVMTGGDTEHPCFAIEDYQPLDQLAMLQGNPYADMDFELERADGTKAKKFARSELHDETFDIDYVVRGSEEQGYAPQNVTAQVLHAQATVCFATPEPFVTADTPWIRLHAGVSKYTFHFE